MALDTQALEAKKAWKPLEQGRALEQVGARMKRVMGLTNKISRPQYAGRLERWVRKHYVKANETALLRGAWLLDHNERRNR